MQNRFLSRLLVTLIAAPAVLLVSAAACQTARAATYIPKKDAPTLSARGGGCQVYTVLAGAKIDLPHPYKVVGEIESKRSKEQMREGGAGAVRAIEVAACEAGVFAVIDIKAYPGGAMDGGATYIGKAAVFLDDNGEFLSAAPKVDAGAVLAEDAVNDAAVNDAGAIEMQ